MRKSIDTVLLVATIYPPYPRLDRPWSSRITSKLYWVHSSPALRSVTDFFKPVVKNATYNQFHPACEESVKIYSSPSYVLLNLFLCTEKIYFCHQSFKTFLSWHAFKSHKASHVYFSECLYTGWVAYSTGTHNFRNSIKKSTAKWNFHWFCYLHLYLLVFETGYF
jgi:hypothetical protein